MQARLNSFQKTMLQWNDLHPYNAVHVVRLPGALDLERLQNSIQPLLETGELAGLTLDRASGTYQLDGRTGAFEIGQIPDDGNPELALRRETERQLNTPFPQGERHAPLRFFVVPAGESVFFGLVYFHAIADAEPVVGLMRQIAERYLGRAVVEVRGPAPIHRPPQRAVRRQDFRLLARKIADFPRRVRAIRACCRPPAGDVLDLTNRWVGFVLDTEDLGALMASARARDVTLNDLLLALLLKCLARLDSGRRWASRRKRLAVGCIVNTRQDVDPERQAVVGVSLGSFFVTHEVPEGISVGDLARDVGGQTLPIKQHRLYLGPSLELALARRLFSWSSPERQRTFYRKNYPLWGGLTNLNLNRLWDQSKDLAPIDYFRAVSTGPATPLVMSFTTVAQHANIGLTYRPGVLTTAQIEGLTQEFLVRVSAMRAER